MHLGSAMNILLCSWPISFTCLVYCFSPGAFAHDAIGMAHPSLQRAEEVSAAASQLAIVATQQRMRSVLDKIARWEPGSKLIACFYGGDIKTRERVIAAGRKWLEDAEVNLKVDFGASPNYRSCGVEQRRSGSKEDIRIGFRDKGHWSWVGTQSHDVDGPSMNLQNFDADPVADQEFNRIVMHEFGHAFGFQHEHQSPAAPDCGFNIPRIKSVLGWTDEEISVNFAKLRVNHKAYRWSQPDPQSIMMYSLDPSLFRDGERSPCYVRQNNSLSLQDRRGMIDAYPMAYDQRRMRENFRAAMPEVSTTLRRMLEIREKLTEEAD